MDDEERTRRFLAERQRRLAAAIRVETETAARLTKLLRQAQRDIAAELAKNPSEYQAARARRLREQIREILKALTAEAGQTLLAAADKSWTAGVDLVDAPLGAAGVEIGGAFDAIDVGQLVAMKAFLTDRIKDIGAELVQRINTQLGLVILGTATPADATSAIARAIDGGRGRALTIVRTNIGAAYSQASQARMAQATTVLPGLKKQWRRSGKIHSRPAHDAADGQVRAVDEPYMVDGVPIMFPRDPKAPAKETINCGCTSLPFMEGWQVSQPGPLPFSAAELAASAFKRALHAARR